MTEEQVREEIYQYCDLSEDTGLAPADTKQNNHKGTFRWTHIFLSQVPVRLSATQDACIRQLRILLICIIIKQHD